MAYNADGTGDSWTSGVDIYDGASGGYNSAHDPGLHIDADDEFHVPFILHSDSNMESIAYIHSEDGETWDDPVTVYETSGDGQLFDPTFDIAYVGFEPVYVITYLEVDEVYLTYSANLGLNWETPVLISTGADIKPDMCVTDDGYVHNVWEHDDGDEDYSIQYIRAQFIPD